MKVAFWLKLVFCYGLLVRLSGVVAFCYSLLPPPKTIPEGHLKSEDHFQPEGHHPQPPTLIRHPLKTCCKACWDTTCNACWDSTPPTARHAGIPPAMYAGIAHPPAARHAGIPPAMLGWHLPVNRMTDRCKNITLATTSLRPVNI